MHKSTFYNLYKLVANDPVKRLTMVLVSCIFASELAVMLMFSVLPHTNTLIESLLDATFLSILCTPIIYFFIFNKISRYVSKLKDVEDLRINATVFDAHEAIVITDAEAKIIRVNHAFEKMTGYAESEVIGKNPSMLSSGRHGKDFYAAMWQELNVMGAWSGEVWDKHKDGTIYPKRLNISAVKNNVGETTQYVGISSDITERKNAEDALFQNERHITTILNSLDEIIWSASAPDFKLHHVSETTEKLYGVSQQEFLNDSELWFRVIHPDDKLRVKKATDQIFNLGKTEIEYRITRSDGQERWLLDRMHVVYEGDGKPAKLVGIAIDVTERKLTQDALKLSVQHAKLALEELKHQKFALDKHAIVAVTDVKGLITYANDKFCEISGYSQDELIGQDHAILNSGYHPKLFFKQMYRTVASGAAWHDEICNRAKDGHLYWVDTTIAPFMGENGKPHSYISIRTDITQRKLAEEKNYQLAFYDTLTHLPNRRLFVDRLAQAMASSARSRDNGALLFLDLDNFKTLNDTLGHDIGDLLLQQVAERLSACVREGDTVARLGGDEFVVILESLSGQVFEAAAQTKLVAEKIQLSLSETYRLAAHEYQGTLSIGVTLFSDQSHTQEDLLKHADIAMYQAKKAGRNTLSFFDPTMQDAINSRVDIECELRKAIDQQQFQLHYQIQVDNFGYPLGAEALIRWIHPERGIIPPFNFIPLAEETGLILQIGRWVLETACNQLKDWEQSTLTQNLVLAVNVSVKQFRQTGFVTQIQEAVQRHGINPARLKLELTESMLLDNIKDIIATMDTLKAIGIKFSLDDFGTGYSSLQYLKMLPLNQLKVDQSFVRDIATDNSDKAIVLTIITMANSLDLNVIAEGVETEEQRQFLFENGCMSYQGYLFSRPVPIHEFEALLRTSNFS